MRHLALILLLLALTSCPAFAAQKPQLWLYYPINFYDSKNVDLAKPIWSRAAAAGYTHLILGDSKFNFLEKMPPAYFKNCARARQIAAELKLEVVPGIVGVGHSNDLLSLDPNLAEGLPVRDQLFVVKNGVMQLVPEPKVDLGKITIQDPGITIEGDVATVHSEKPSARFGFNVAVHPFRCYRVSASIKTTGLSGMPAIRVFDGRANLQWQGIHNQSTQDWTVSDVIFNSLDHSHVTIEFAGSQRLKGGLEWKDWSIEEIGLVNVLRRPGAPCIVKLEDSGKVLTEGQDYDLIVDPHLGNVPYAGEYQAYHAAPVIHTKLADGTRLRVSWYHPAIFGDGKVPICFSEPKMSAMLADQARRLKEIWQAPRYLAARYDYLIINWDESCQSRKLTPGQIIAASLKERAKLFEPAQAVVMGDMFDPLYHGGKGRYFLANGSLEGSWEGLSKEMLLVNSNYRARDASLKFFADLGIPQLISAYDDKDFNQVAEWLMSAKKVTGIGGYMYASILRDYSAIEKFAQKVRE